ncbi:MAG TPA: hypothetical protein VH370_00385 [Humisphaera sp.]|nr:hypothetical protein [Humisphaera sp.]
MRSLCILLVGLLLLESLGCAARPKEPPAYFAPPAKVTVRHFPGTPLSGPQATKLTEQSSRDALAINARFFSLEQMPKVELPQVGERARLVAVTRGDTPVISTAQLTASARVALPAQAAKVAADLAADRLTRTRSLANLTEALPIGITTQFDFVDPNASAHSFAVALYRPPPAANESSTAALQIGLTVRSMVTLPPHRDSAPEPPALQTETVLLDPIELENGVNRFVLIAPFSFAGNPSWGIAVIIEAGPGTDDPMHQERFARAMADAAQESAKAAAYVSIATQPADDWPALAAALSALNNAAQQRQTLAMLAGQTNAQVCLDYALAADAPGLAKLAKRVLDQMSSVPHDEPSVSWLLDRSSFELLAEALNSGAMPPELAEVLTRYAGEPGRHAGAVDEVLHEGGSRADFSARLIAENLVFLEDTSPASRVRAFEWLATIGKTPLGYDPLAPSRERHAALDKALGGGDAPNK